MSVGPSEQSLPRTTSRLSTADLSESGLRPFAGISNGHKTRRELGRLDNAQLADWTHRMLTIPDSSLSDGSWGRSSSLS